MTDRPESRKFPRFAVELDAQVQIEGQTVAAVTRDVSRGGICLVSPRQVEAGSNLQLSLLLMLGANAFSEGLELTGRVIWCTPLGHLFQLGAVFINMTPEKRGLLEMFLRFLQQEILMDGGEPPAVEEQFDTGGEDDS